MQTKISIIFASITLLISCMKVDIVHNCNDQVVVSSKLFEKAPNDYFNINSVTIAEDTLFVSISSGGGCGYWEVKLIDQGTIAESDPPQRTLRISLKDKDTCEALITARYSFDISCLKTDGNQVILNLLGWNEPILYQY